MTKPEQRIAIAEACGWKKVRHQHSIDWEHWDHDGWRAEPPDYPNDLNAMHEARLSLNALQQSQFAIELMLVLGIDTNTPTEPSEMFEFCNATAAQRAEAFLRTIGKWRD